VGYGCSLHPSGNATQFWVHRYSDAVGRRLETYLGKADEPETLAKVSDLRVQLDCRMPSTSFAEPGGSRLRVDLLVPSSNDTYPTIPVPELQAYAKGLPYLAYLLGASQEVPILSPHGAVMVRVPVPERYAVHKLVVSQLRDKTSSKSEKDLRQAATLIEALVERFPGAVEDALAACRGSRSVALSLREKRSR
jgi:hypothetical protein